MYKWISSVNSSYRYQRCAADCSASCRDLCLRRLPPSSPQPWPCETTGALADDLWPRQPGRCPISCSLKCTDMRILSHCFQCPKTAWQFWKNLSGKSIFRKIFKGEIFIRTIPTTLLQISCKIILNSKVIVKSIRDPENTS